MADVSLIGMVALVTGASRGIGRAIAIELASGGAEVYINYISSDQAAKETLDKIQSSGSKAHLLKFDVSNPSQVGEAVDSIIKESGKIDILVNNAGLTKDALLMRMKEEDWERVLDVNLKGPFVVTRAVVRSMIKARYGRIVNMASVVGQGGHEGQANYAASKAGIEGLTKSLAKELAGRNITVNAVAPGFIETDLTAKLDARAKAAILEQIPMGRFGRPEEVAALVRWLVGEEASYITGAVIPINGGIYM